MDETSGPEQAPSPGGTPTRLERGWHLVAVSTGSLAPPIGLGVLHPVVGEALAGAELAVLLTIIGTALFGSKVLSERAFRLLRWLGNRPEPPEPPSAAGAATVTTGRAPAARDAGAGEPTSGVPFPKKIADAGERAASIN